MVRFATAVCALACVLCACQDRQSSWATRLIKAHLSDPDSAEFKNLAPGLLPNSIRGSVNSKNKFGGYVGYKHFVAGRTPDGKDVVMLEQGDGQLKNIDIPDSDAVELSVSTFCK
jgi:hypothetical protein